MTKDDAAKANKHIPYQDSEDTSVPAAVTPNEPIYVPKNKDGDLKNVITGADV